MTDRPRDRPPLHAVPDDDQPGWTPPFDRAAEEATLAAAITNPNSLNDITQTVTASDFYDHAHELIYDAITNLYSRTRPVDKITVANQLGKSLDRARGRTYLEHLTNLGIGIIDGTWHAQIVAEHAALRRLQQHHIRGLADIENRGNAPAADLYQRTAQQLENIPRGVPGVDNPTPPNTWAPVDFAAVLDGDLTNPKATVLQRRDGKPLLYPYAVHSISGEPGSLKTWVALLAIVQELENGNNAALIDFEDRAGPVASRLLQIGANPDHLRDPARWRYIRPDTALDTPGTTALDAAVADCTITVIDGVTEAMSLHGWSINDNDDVAAYVTKLPRRIADRGPAVLQIDHVTKDSETRGRYAIGGQHKLASITGTAMKALVVRSGGRGEHGVIKIVLDKDKHGDVGPSGHTIAEFHLDDTQDGQTFAWLDHPTASVDDEGHFRPTTLMGRVSDYLTTHGGSTGAAIRSGVKGKNESIAEAIDALIREGHIRTEPAPRGGVFHYLVTPFEATP